MTQPCRQSLKVKGDTLELLSYLGKAEMCHALFFFFLFYRRAEQLKFTLSPGFINGIKKPFDMLKPHIHLSSDQISSLSKSALKDPIAEWLGFLEATC